MPPPVTLPHAIIPLSIRKQWFTPMQSNSYTFFYGPLQTVYTRGVPAVFFSRLSHVRLTERIRFFFNVFTQAA